MKSILSFLLLMSLLSCVTDSEAIKEAENYGGQPQVDKHERVLEEDCDTKAKKTAEQKVEEAINLQGGGDEGCTLE